MTKTVLLTALSGALALSACSKNADEPDAGASTPAAVETTDSLPAAAPTEGKLTPGPVATPVLAPTVSPTASASEIPASARGRWGLVPKDCTSKLGDAKGLLTVSAGQLKFYESVAKLGKVKEAGDGHFRATFQYSGEGQSWTQDVVLEVADGGKTLIRRDYGPDAAPSPQTYTRCT
jgi:hypothetical protein